MTNIVMLFHGFYSMYNYHDTQATIIQENHLGIVQFIIEWLIKETQMMQFVVRRRIMSFPPECRVTKQYR